MSELEDLARGTGADARSARRTLKRRAASAARGGAEEFSPLIDALDDLAGRLAPAQRLGLSRGIATDLRAANAKRIRANVEPDDDAMTPRKARQSGRLRSRRLRDIDATGRYARVATRAPRMFARATSAGYLRKESTTGAAQVGFVGAMARIMRVHHYGLRDTVTRNPGSPAVTYPERAVLGMSPDDRLRILDRVTAQVQP